MLIIPENRFVRKLSTYVDLNELEKSELAKLTAQARTVPAKIDLFREGDRPGPLLVMLSGWAFRYKILLNGSRQITSFVIPGDACDLHNSLLNEMDHGLQTVTECSVVSVSRRGLHELMASSPNVARAMYISGLADEGTLRSWIVSMGRRTSIERVAHLVCELYLRAHPGGGVAAGGFELPLSQVVLADALGMTTVHINRVLKTLRLDGIMYMSRGTLTIVDPIALVRTAGFSEAYLQRGGKTYPFDGASVALDYVQ